MENVNLWLALWAGFASFISPCCLPLYPSFISYITGISVTELKSGVSSKSARRSMMLHTLSFIVGFSLVFYTMGFAANMVSDIFKDNSGLLRQIAAILIFVMGLMLIGVFQPKWLMKERKLNIKFKPAGYLGSLLVGIGFSAGWSPCVGPILTAILALSTSEPGTWFGLITAYSLGFAIPFFILSFFIGSTKWIVRYSGAFMKVGGVVMMLMAILLYTDQLSRITAWLNGITPAWLQF